MAVTRLGRLIRWGIAGVCVLGIVVVLRGEARGPLELGFKLVVCVILGGIGGTMIAVDVSQLLAKVFIDGILNPDASPPKPLPRTHATARALRAQGRYGEAIEEYQRVLEADPADIEAQTAMAEICADKLGSYERAVKEYNHLLAMNLNPGQRVATLNRLADLYEQELGAPAFAGNCLQEIMRRFPDTHFAAAAHERLDALVERHPELAAKK